MTDIRTFMVPPFLRSASQRLVLTSSGRPAVSSVVSRNRREDLPRATGGFARSELEGAGAKAVYEHLGELADDLDRVGGLAVHAGAG